MKGVPSMKTDNRTITMTIDGPAAEGGMVPLRVLSKKLEALQKTLFNLAEAQGGGPVAQRGNWKKYVRSSCELIFSETRRGSLTIVATLPAPPSNEQLLLFPDDEKDPGLRTLEGIKEASIAVVNKNMKRIVELLPDSVGRARFLKSLEDLCPREGDEFNVALGYGQGGNFAEFSRDSRSFIKKLFTEEAEEGSPESQTIHGTLVEIRGFSGQHHITVKRRQQEIPCYYPSEMAEQIAQLIVGSIVEVTGTCQTRDDGMVSQIDTVTDVTTIDLSPFRIKTFAWGQKKYILKEPVLCTVDYEGELWIYKVPLYGLHACAADRQEALSQLHEFFAFDYDDRIGEKSENLTLDAIELRERLKEEVLSVEEVH